MPRLAFSTFTILRQGFGHPEVQGSFDRMAGNIATADR